MVDKHAKVLLSATKNRAIALENVANGASKCIKCSKTKKKKTRIATYFVSTGLENVAIGWHKSKKCSSRGRKCSRKREKCSKLVYSATFFSFDTALANKDHIAESLMLLHVLLQNFPL